MVYRLINFRNNYKILVDREYWLPEWNIDSSLLKPDIPKGTELSIRSESNLRLRSKERTHSLKDTWGIKTQYEMYHSVITACYLEVIRLWRWKWSLRSPVHQRKGCEQAAAEFSMEWTTTRQVLTIRSDNEFPSTLSKPTEPCVLHSNRAISTKYLGRHLCRRPNSVGTLV